MRSISILFTGLTVSLAACASSTGVQPVSSDTYRIANSERGNAGDARYTANVEAAQYCSSLGKEMFVINEQSRSDLMQGYSDLTFQCRVTRADALKVAADVCKTALHDDGLRPLVGRLPFFSVSEITVQMLSIESLPTAAEAKAIGALIDARNKCSKELIPPTERAESFKFRRDLVFAELLKRKVSYGNANRLLKQAQLEALDQWNEQARQEAARAQTLELERQRIEIQRRQAEAQASAARAAAISALFPPTTTTNCSWVGQSMRCTSN